MRTRQIIILFFFVTLLGTICQGRVSSRIEGIVLDKETGKPIQGAKVLLYNANKDLIDLFDWETKTNQKGFFVFDTEDIYGTFYIQCYKEGYIPFLPEYYKKNIKEEYVEEVFGLFKLQEGQIKHIKVELERGGGLIGEFLVKDSSGLSVLKDTGVFLNRMMNESDTIFSKCTYFEVFYTNLDENGKFEIQGIEPFGNYFISVIPNGYWSQSIGKIEIENKKTIKIPFVIDCTNTATIKGYLTVNKQIVYSGDVTIKNQKQNEFGTYNYCSYTLKNEKYYCLKGIPAGEYLISAYGIIKGNESKEREIYITLKKNELKIYNFEL